MRFVEDRRQFESPVRHRRKVPFAPNIKVPKDFAELNRKIFQLDSELDRFLLKPNDYFELIKEAFASNIHHSTELEGNPLGLEEVRRITRETFREPHVVRYQSEPDQEIVNHLIAWLSNIFRGSWSLEMIKGVHDMLLSGHEGGMPGEFRTTRTSVIADDGQETFIPAPPEHIEDELHALLEWLNDYGAGYSPLVTATVFFHEFESIHPFTDGNGRTGRTLFHGYLQSRGLPNSKLCMIEAEILKDKELYYELLAKTDFHNDHEPLIEHFTRAVYRSYKNAEEKFREKDLLTSDIDELSKRILIKAKRKGDWFDLRDLRVWCVGESDYKLRSRLNSLVELNIIDEKGRTKGKRYIFRDPLKEIQRKFQQRVDM